MADRQPPTVSSSLGEANQDPPPPAYNVVISSRYGYQPPQYDMVEMVTLPGTPDYPDCSYHPLQIIQTLPITSPGTYFPPPDTNYPPVATGYNPLSATQLHVHQYITTQPSPEVPLQNLAPINIMTGEANGTLAMSFKPIETKDLVKKEAPKQCEQGFLEHYPNIQLGPGQPPTFREYLPDERWKCAVPCSLAAYPTFAICTFLLISWVPYYTDLYGYGATTIIYASVFLCLSYLVAVIEGSCSKVNGFVSNVTKAADFIKTHEGLLLAVPTIVMRVVAFHKEARTTTTDRIRGTTYDNDYRTVVTHTECNTFPFSKCIDVSEPMEMFLSGVINRIESEKTFGFLNQQTANRYDQMRKVMIERAKRHDIDSLFTTEFYIPKFKNLVTVYTEEDSRTRFMSPVFYKFLNYFLCSWPYRIFFWRSTQKRNYTYVKLISL